MINIDKITKKPLAVQVAGLNPSDDNIEFIGIPATQQVFWMRNGNSLPFECLPLTIFQNCQEQYLNDEIALKELSALPISQDRQVEMYIYHLYGDVDATPDIIDGVLQPSENFRDTPNCSSIQWKSKWITIDGVVMTPRDLTIIDCIKNDLPNKAIAAKLGITPSTLDFHIRNLFKKVNVPTRTALIVKALNQHV
ncbi:MAG: hypothetical protein COB81_11230 [Flavobacteriaceae bacterium]|nr:MAG: hypothetical protein COB81_11230 [Flavobacteriaceae bacterium]